MFLSISHSICNVPLQQQFLLPQGLFFWISACPYYRDNKVDTLKVRKQILNLLLLYIMFSVLLYGLKIPLAMFTDNKMSLGDALLNLFFPNTIMWYLCVLAAITFTNFPQQMSIK